MIYRYPNRSRIPANRNRRAHGLTAGAGELIEPTRNPLASTPSAVPVSPFLLVCSFAAHLQIAPVED
jgi:hypothetical protein